MSYETAGLIWTGAGVYAGLGLVFALIFVTLLLGRVSPGARTAAPVQVRLLLIPAAMALWPLLLLLVLTKREGGGDEAQS